MKTQIFVAALLFSLNAQAQESPAESQAIRCGALTHIHTIISSPPAFNEAMAQATEFYGGVFAAFRETRTGSSATNGEVSGRRDTVEAELRKTWQTKPELVVREMALCNSWRAEFAPRIAAFNSEIRNGKQAIEIVGTPPSAPSPGEIDKWRPIVSTAFTAWAESGSKTGGEARSELKKNLLESLPKK